MAWWKKFQPIIYVATLAASTIAYAYQNFATKEYVNIKHEGVMEVLEDIRKTVHTLEKQQYDAARERGKHGR